VSKMRPEVVDAKGERSPDYADSIYMIRDSVRRRERLIFGKLNDGYGEHCAIGCFFADNPKLALQSKIIDEVATYNDSIPKHVSAITRKRKVLEWLNFKLRVLASRRHEGANSC
jgi:hypothetical protein